MKTFLISGVSAFVLAGAAMAVPFEEADTDGDGRISFEELQAVDPAVTEAEFTLYDVNLDGYLDEDEYAAWRIATQRDTDPAPLDEPLVDDPLVDEFETPEEPMEEPEPFDPEPSLEKSLTKSDEHGYGDDEDKDEDRDRDGGYGEGYGSDDEDELDEDEITEQLNEEQAEELDEEDGGEERPW